MRIWKEKSIFTYIEITTVVVMCLGALFVAYLSFTSGTKDARDAKRLADVLSINDSLKVYYSQNNVYPDPDVPVNITASGEILTYQGYVSEPLFSLLNTSQILDPLGDKNFLYLNYYTYATNVNKQKFQLMGFFELDKQVSYNPLNARKAFNYGDKVGIALEQETQRPIQETKRSVDILKTQDNYVIYLDDKNVISGDKSKLKVLISQTQKSQSLSCKEIRDAGVEESGYYFINPLSGGAYENFGKVVKVYCDMTSDGGGWTRLYYKNGKETCINDGISYNKFMLEKLFTKDFAVSDQLETLHSEGSWILHDVDLNNNNFNFQKMTHIANCKTPSGEYWSMEYGKDDEEGVQTFLTFQGLFSTLGTWKEMFYGCGKYVSVGNNVHFRVGGRLGHTGEFINSSCSDYSSIDNSITSRWDWDNTRVIWVR